MKGWGRVSCLVLFGLALGAGCGGRTSTLGEGYGPPDGSGADGSGADGNGARGGAGSTAGRPSRGGSGPAFGGNVSVGGTGIVYPGGAYTGGGYPVGGYYGYGGAVSSAGYPAGGYYGYGGTFAQGGFSYGGNPNLPAGACCRAHDGPNCRPRAVAQCVCQAEPYCCDKLWDQNCVNLIEPLGCGFCEADDCQGCLNGSCSAELSACFQDFGCLSIFGCMQTTGCQAFQCYSDGQCKGVIDQWGGPAGDAMSKLLVAYSCAIQSGCPCN